MVGEAKEEAQGSLPKKVEDEVAFEVKVAEEGQFFIRRIPTASSSTSASSASSE